MIQLTDNQRALIFLAVETGGRIESYPSNLKGGARASVVRGLLRDELIAADGPVYALTDAGYEAVGQQRPSPAGTCAASNQPASKPGKQRENTRLAEVIALLQRPEGATIAQVMAATQWQPHSVRGLFAGTLKKKGYTITNEKTGKGDRVYRIQSEEALSAKSEANEASGGGEE